MADWEEGRAERFTSSPWLSSDLGCKHTIYTHTAPDRLGEHTHLGNHEVLGVPHHQLLPHERGSGATVLPSSCHYLHSLHRHCLAVYLQLHPPSRPPPRRPALSALSCRRPQSSRSNGNLSPDLTCNHVLEESSHFPSLLAINKCHVTHDRLKVGGARSFGGKIDVRILRCSQLETV